MELSPRPTQLSTEGLGDYATQQVVDQIIERSDAEIFRIFELYRQLGRQANGNSEPL